MASRKLQVEIDRVLKKVAEGVADFEELFEKINQAGNANQKEKIEQDLKKEIKKLQRLRDQIKVWISSSEIKDKRALLDNRKLIETQMERFKALEREMKTKQYSKEGLEAKEKLDPAEVAKTESANWISNMVDKLNTQVDTLEAKSEQIYAAKTKRIAKADAERLKQIEAALERHKFHMTKLETMLRLLENESLTVDDVESVKDSVEYYIESNMEPDFMDDNEIYDHLDLVEDETLGTIGQLEEHGQADNNDDDSTKKRPSSKEQDHEVPAKTSGKVPSKPTSATGSSKSAKVPATAIKVSSMAAPIPATVKTPPQKYATAVAGSVAVDSKKVPPTVAPTSSVTTATIPRHSPELKLHPAPVAADVTRSPPVEMSFSSVVAASAQKSESSTPVPALVEPPTASRSGSSPTQWQSTNKFPSQFVDLVSSFQAARSKSYGNGDQQLQNQHLVQMLDASLHQCPDIVDIERPEPFTPTRPLNTPAYYPLKPFLAFTSPIAFEKLDTDTLFFIFYYQQGTRQQILAARELKRQSWRFHKKYLTWFQRHEEPKSITDEYEQGTYIYFDYEGAWCQRKKTEFTFEYRFLEDDG